MSKISKAVDQTPSSVTSTPRTPRIDLASRLAGKTKKEKDKKEREKGERRLAASVARCQASLSVPDVSACFFFQPRGRSRLGPVWTQKA